MKQRLRTYPTILLLLLVWLTLPVWLWLIPASFDFEELSCQKYRHYYDGDSGYDA
jgi:hypothetical protein